MGSAAGASPPAAAARPPRSPRRARPSTARPRRAQGDPIMTAIAHALAKALLVNLMPTAARTATGQGSAVNLLDYEGTVALVLDSAAGTGTQPTTTTPPET